MLSHSLALDPADALSELVPAQRRAEDTWLAGWRSADELAAEAMLGVLGGGGLSEPAVAAELGVLLPQQATLFVASSMPVRDIETFWPIRPDPPRVLCNRGANGIDGTVSAAFGAAAAGSGPVVLLIGDVALAHDIGGLLAAERLQLKLTIVLLDNGGGGIFDFLPVSRAAMARSPAPPGGESDEDIYDASHRNPDRARLRQGRDPLRALTRSCPGRWRAPCGARAGARRRAARASSKCAASVRATSICTGRCGALSPVRSAREQGQQRRQLDLRLGQLGGRVGVRARCRCRRSSGRPSRAAARSAARRRTPRRRSRRSSRRDPSTSRDRGPRAPGSAAPRQLSGSPPTAGVGCISPASSSASIGAVSWARIGVARCWMLAIFTSAGSGAAATHTAWGRSMRSMPRARRLRAPRGSSRRAGAARRGGRRRPGRRCGGSSRQAPACSRDGPRDARAARGWRRRASHRRGPTQNTKHDGNSSRSTPTSAAGSIRERSMNLHFAGQHDLLDLPAAISSHGAADRRLVVLGRHRARHLKAPDRRRVEQWQRRPSATRQGAAARPPAGPRAGHPARRAPRASGAPAALRRGPSARARARARSAKPARTPPSAARRRRRARRRSRRRRRARAAGASGRIADGGRRERAPALGHRARSARRPPPGG